MKRLVLWLGGLAFAVAGYFAIIFSAYPAEAQETRTWHLFTLTDKGVINLLHGLTKRECEYALHRAKGEPATDEEIAAEKKRDAEIEERRVKERAELIKAHPICGRSDWLGMSEVEQKEWVNYCTRPESMGGATYAGNVLYFQRAECFE